MNKGLQRLRLEVGNSLEYCIKSVKHIEGEDVFSVRLWVSDAFQRDDVSCEVERLFKIDVVGPLKICVDFKKSLGSLEYYSTEENDIPEGYWEYSTTSYKLFSQPGRTVTEKFVDELFERINGAARLGVNWRSRTKLELMGLLSSSESELIGDASRNFLMKLIGVFESNQMPYFLKDEMMRRISVEEMTQRYDFPIEVLTAESFELAGKSLEIRLVYEKIK